MKSGPKTPSTTESAPAALYGHCESTYTAMIAEAKSITSAETLLTTVVWEGMLVNLITGKLHLSVPYYSSITKALKRMGCIRQIRRGGGTSPSLWEIIKAPSIEGFLKDLPIREVAKSKQALIQTQLDSLIARVGVLEGIFKEFFDKELAASEQEGKQDE